MTGIEKLRIEHEKKFGKPSKEERIEQFRKNHKEIDSYGLNFEDMREELNKLRGR